MIAINDAAPVDDSTILANDENLLPEHFRAVAGQLSAHEGLILLCVGLHKSVARYFKNSKWTDDAEGVFPVAVSSLVEVL
ncbi:cobaltochelatase CobT-related protein [Salinarimonas sp.]|uniref:cobaltochelatase CobT-related protein n=1 Tax=Salinarimonas sp. TaxID=2766526 RepID=UPI003918D60C